MITKEQHPEQAAYRLPRPLLAALAWSLATGRQRSLASDTRRAVDGLPGGIYGLGYEHIPASGACLVVCNHYHRPGFAAWWIAVSISAAIAAHRSPEADPEVHWVMTAAWRYADWRGQVLTPLTRRMFSRIARVYGFVTMPPMPPDPSEVEARAVAMRRCLHLARELAGSGGMLGLAPEGYDAPGEFGNFPPGAGTFMALLVKAGLPLLPVGLGEREGRLAVSFGPLFWPEFPSERALVDREVAQQAIGAIATQLNRI